MRHLLPHTPYLQDAQLYIKPYLPTPYLPAAFLASLREVHAAWHTTLKWPGKATEFEDAFTAWMNCLGGASGIKILGLDEALVDGGVFGCCPVCAVSAQFGEVTWASAGVSPQGQPSIMPCAAYHPSCPPPHPSTSSFIPHPLPSDDPASEDFEPHLRSISLDAVNKVNHFAKQGAATADVQPNVRVFYSQQQAKVEQRVKAGTLKAGTFTLQQTVGGDPRTTSGASCSASLNCSRPDSTHLNKATDITGVVGGVCTHSVPLQGAFLDMLTHENFSSYLILLRSLIDLLLEEKKVRPPPSQSSTTRAPPLPSELTHCPSLPPFLPPHPPYALAESREREPRGLWRRHQGLLRGLCVQAQDHVQALH